MTRNTDLLRYTCWGSRLSPVSRCCRVGSLPAKQRLQPRLLHHLVQQRGPRHPGKTCFHLGRTGFHRSIIPLDLHKRWSPLGSQRSLHYDRKRSCSVLLP